jgi:hypothetical protein
LEPRQALPYFKGNFTRSPNFTIKTFRKIHVSRKLLKTGSKPVLSSIFEPRQAVGTLFLKKISPGARISPS